MGARTIQQQEVDLFRYALINPQGLQNIPLAKLNPIFYIGSRLFPVCSSFRSLGWL